MFEGEVFTSITTNVVILFLVFFFFLVKTDRLTSSTYGCRTVWSGTAQSCLTAAHFKWSILSAQRLTLEVIYNQIDFEAIITITRLVRREHHADFFFSVSLFLTLMHEHEPPLKKLPSDRVLNCCDGATQSQRLKSSRQPILQRWDEVELEWTHLLPQQWIFTPLLLVNRKLREVGGGVCHSCVRRDEARQSDYLFRNRTVVQPCLENSCSIEKSFCYIKHLIWWQVTPDIGNQLPPMSF